MKEKASCRPKRQRKQGELDALTAHKRGPKVVVSSLVKENRELQADVTRLTRKLKNAELIIEVQKKWLRCWATRFRMGCGWKTFVRWRSLRRGSFDLSLIQAHSVPAAKVANGLAEFEIYIKNNCDFIPNFGKRWRQGERISTAFVESTINQVVSRRFVKKQQMQWTHRGAHLRLQARTKVPNDELEGVLRRWYPRFRPQAA